MSHPAAARRVEIPLLPALGLSAATGGALALGAAGLIGSATGIGVSCLFAAATGVDCPFCGMTHGVAALGTGDLAAAVAANPLAPFAVAAALVVPVALAYRRPLRVPAAVLWAVVALIVSAWLLRVL